MNLFAPLSSDVRTILDGIPELIDKTFPMPGRFRSALPANVAELSQALTSGRSGRPLSYLNRPHLLSAYFRFFLPWNLYRLCRLLPALDIRLAENDSIIDIGSGPLTVALALWIARPELRGLSLQFTCIDSSSPALEAGKKLLTALAGRNCPWKIQIIKKTINSKYGEKMPPVSGKEKTASLVCAVNVFNEIYRDIQHIDAKKIQQCAEKAANLLCLYAGGTAAIFVVEPGIPQSGQFVSLLRDVLTEKKRPPRSPCPHQGGCPFPGGISRTGKKRWCHFAFETNDAPKALHGLSAAAGIPKERATLSFLLTDCQMTGRQISPNADSQTRFQDAAQDGVIAARVITDAFPLPQGRLGRYCCSQAGLVLAEGEHGLIDNLHSGSLIQARLPQAGKRDPKSGALITADFFV